MAHLLYEKGKNSTIQFPVTPPGITIGRLKDCDVCIDDTLVSKEHFRIEIVELDGKADEVEFFIEDLASTNNTYVNDRKITRKKLRHNDVIRVGITQLRFVEYEGENYDSTAVIKKSWIPGVYYTRKKAGNDDG